MSKIFKNEFEIEIENLCLQNIKLKRQNDDLIDENKNLQFELDNLNENTVICSMNDMKKQVEELKESTVPIYLYEHLKDCYKKCFYIIKTIDQITSIVSDEICDLKETIFNENFTVPFKNKRIEYQLNSIDNSLSMIQKIVNKDDYEWNENDCHCEFLDH